MSDANALGLGKVITTKQHRDAIHVAVAPVKSAGNLRPGEHVGFLPDGRVGHCEKPIGIVDPFLVAKMVRKDEEFWLFLYPGTITSLRHEWTHSDFDPEDPFEAEKVLDAMKKPEAERRIRGALREAGYADSYDKFIKAIQTDGRVCFGDNTAGPELGDDQEFWDDVEIVLGKRLSREERSELSSNFSCAC